jgi:DNA-binding transcriptional LysR family regulator
MIGPADTPLLAAFAAVARRGSYSRAAEDLRLSKSVISERVKLLEERCGARLLERTTRSVRLTEAGQGALAAAIEVDAALTRLSASLDARRQEPSGTLRVSTTNDLGPLLVAPTAARLLSTYPRARVVITAGDALHDLMGEAIDVAVRLGAPRSSSLVVRKLAVLEEPIVAAPALAERWGHVSRPPRAERCAVDPPQPTSRARAALHGPGGRDRRADADGARGGRHGRHHPRAAAERRGRGRVPRARAGRAPGAGRLVQLCSGWVWKRVHLFALTPSRVGSRSLAGLFLAMLREQLELDRARWRTRPGLSAHHRTGRGTRPGSTRTGRPRDPSLHSDPLRPPRAPPACRAWAAA